MSRDAARTADEILQAARTLLEERGFHGVGLEEVARAAGVSRQAVYLHFGSKTKLLLALVDWVDRRHELGRRLVPVLAAEDPGAAIALMVRMAATYAPEIHRLAVVFDTARRTDAAAKVAWNDRMASRRNGCALLVRRLAAARRLADGWSIPTATDFLWTLISVETFDNLSVECGWPARRVANVLSRVAVKTLVCEPKGISRATKRRSSTRRSGRGR